MLQVCGTTPTLNDLATCFPILHDSATCRGLVNGFKGLPHPGCFSFLGWMLFLDIFRFQYLCCLSLSPGFQLLQTFFSKFCILFVSVVDES